MDKAALLGSVVEQVRDLKRKASELSKLVSTPTEVDEVSIEIPSNINQGHQNSHDVDEKNVLIKATFSCEDRPDLIGELIRVLKGLNLSIVGAEIACLGGRMKGVLLLYNKDANGDIDKEGDHNVCNIIAIKHSLMAVLERIVSWSTSAPNFRVASKRQRFFFSP